MRQTHTDKLPASLLACFGVAFSETRGLVLSGLGSSWGIGRGGPSGEDSTPSPVVPTNSVIPVVGPVLDSVLLSLSSSSEGSIRIKARWNDNNKFITRICKQQQQQ